MIFFIGSENSCRNPYVTRKPPASAGGWFFREVINHIAVFSETIGFLLLGDGAIFDGFHRTVADAGHAVGAVITPDRFLLPQLNIVQGTELLAFAAADAGILHIKILCGKL